MSYISCYDYVTLYHSQCSIPEILQSDWSRAVLNFPIQHSYGGQCNYFAFSTVMAACQNSTTSSLETLFGSQISYFSTDLDPTSAKM